ncbi:hypothetical protein BDR06DRAFT_960561 [Suillus hirtellus]|nr:hypothetical protein BDR06DRAFT_960561 [Suillus hirtellus]
MIPPQILRPTSMKERIGGVMIPVLDHGRPITVITGSDLNLRQLDLFPQPGILSIEELLLQPTFKKAL